MGWDPALDNLKSLVAALYPRKELSFQVVDSAGLKQEWVSFSDRGVDNWHNILLEAKERGKLGKLVEVIADQYEGAEAARTLQETYRTYLAGVAQRQPAPVDNVSLGLRALATLVSLPEVRHIMLLYRDDFQRASRKIDDMGNYKDLHDLLHELQVHCHDPIIQIAERPRSYPKAWEDLKAHRETLQTVVNVLNVYAARDTFNKTEMRWIQDFLGQADGFLKRAIAGKDAKQLRSAASLINRVLDVQPTLVNQQLNQAARDLQLQELAISMTIIRDKILQLDRQDSEAARFIAGVADMVALSETLSAQIQVHDIWQVVDRDLRQIEPDLGRDMDELKCSWGMIKKYTVPLYQGNREPWAKDFRAVTDKLDKAIKANRRADIRESFRDYRRKAVNRFYVVDIKLKDFCGELRKIGGAPLDAVNRALEVAGAGL